MNSKKLLAGLNVKLLLSEAKLEYAKEHNKNAVSLYEHDLEFYSTLKFILTNLEDDGLVEKYAKCMRGGVVEFDYQTKDGGFAENLPQDVAEKVFLAYRRELRGEE